MLIGMYFLIWEHIINVLPTSVLPVPKWSVLPKKDLISNLKIVESHIKILSVLQACFKISPPALPFPVTSISEHQRAVENRETQLFIRLPAQLLFFFFKRHHKRHQIMGTCCTIYKY